MANDNFFVKNKSIITFLILEVVALTAFNFGNISYIFGIAGAALALLAIPFVFKNEANKKQFIWLALPLGILFFISATGSFNAFSKGFTVGSNISLLLSLPSFFVLGFFLRKLNDVKPKTVLLVIGAGLAAITFFGLVSTVIEYGFFYSLIYKSSPNYYYSGIPYDVTKEMFWLNGFEFGEVFIEYGSSFAILCSTFLFGLLFLSPKKDRNEFIICSVIGGVGLLTLLVIPNWKAIIILVLVSAIAFIYKFLKNNKKVLKILGIFSMWVLSMGIAFFVLALVNAGMGFKFTGILDRVFVSNGIMIKCKPVFEALFAKTGGKLMNFFGLKPTSLTETVTLAETNIFEVQLLKEIGLIGTFVFIDFVIIMAYFLLRYFKKSEDGDHIKVIFASMLLEFFIFETLFNVIQIAPHGESYDAFLRSPTLLVVLFIFGYLFSAPEFKEKKHE